MEKENIDQVFVYFEGKSNVPTRFIVSYHAMEKGEKRDYYSEYTYLPGESIYLEDVYKGRFGHDNGANRKLDKEGSAPAAQDVIGVPQHLIGFLEKYISDSNEVMCSPDVNRPLVYCVKDGKAQGDLLQTLQNRLKEGAAEIEEGSKRAAQALISFIDEESALPAEQIVRWIENDKNKVESNFLEAVQAAAENLKTADSRPVYTSTEVSGIIDRLRAITKETGVNFAIMQAEVIEAKIPSGVLPRSLLDVGLEAIDKKPILSK